MSVYCGACGTPTNQGDPRVAGKPYHTACLRCVYCGVQLTPPATGLSTDAAYNKYQKSYQVFQGAPVCPQHWDGLTIYEWADNPARNLCSACGEVIPAPQPIVMLAGKALHRACIGCAYCGRRLEKQDVWELMGHNACYDCSGRQLLVPAPPRVVVLQPGQARPAAPPPPAQQSQPASGQPAYAPQQAYPPPQQAARPSGAGSSGRSEVVERYSYEGPAGAAPPFPFPAQGGPALGAGSSGRSERYEKYSYEGPAGAAPFPPQPQGYPPVQAAQQPQGYPAPTQYAQAPPQPYTPPQQAYAPPAVAPVQKSAAAPLQYAQTPQQAYPPPARPGLSAPAVYSSGRTPAEGDDDDDILPPPPPSAAVARAQAPQQSLTVQRAPPPLQAQAPVQRAKAPQQAQPPPGYQQRPAVQASRPPAAVQQSQPPPGARAKAPVQQAQTPSLAALTIDDDDDIPPPAPPSAARAATWLEYKDPDGYPYYYNPDTKQTVWEKPH